MGLSVANRLASKSTRIGMAGVAAMVALGLTACQSYQAVPLDRASHLEEWKSRAISPSLPDDGRSGFSESWDNEHTIPGVKIRLAQAERTALLFNPSLRRARAEAGVAAASAAEAGKLADPTLELGIQSLLKGGASPWTLGLGLGFSIPLSGRLGAEKDLAKDGVSVAVASAALQEYEVVLELRLLWVRLSLIPDRLDALRFVHAELDEVTETVKAARGAGRMSAAEAAAFEIEGEVLNAEKAFIEGEQRQLAAKIKALIGLPNTVELSPVPATVGNWNAKLIPQVIPDSHPALVLRRAEYSQAESALRLAIEKQYPDLSLTPGLEWDQGEPKGGVGISIPIPIIDGNRREISEARAARSAAKVSFEAVVEEVTNREQELKLEGELADAELKRIREGVLKIVLEQIQRLKLLTVEGRGEPLMLLDALRMLHEQRSASTDAVLVSSLAAMELDTIRGFGMAHRVNGSGSRTGEQSPESGEPNDGGK